MPRPLTEWDGQLRWAVKGPSIFDDEDDEMDAFSYRPNIMSRQPSSDLWIFQYGLRYRPDADDGNVYRTVKIDQLPSTTTLDQILPVIDGEMYSARLLNTRHIVGSNTAIVTFVQQSDAMQLLRFAHQSGKKIQVGTGSARVSLVPTPTYPISAEVEKLIQKGHTRCLAVSNITEKESRALDHIIDRSVCSNYLECMEERAGTVYIRFHSIKMGSIAYDLLNHHPSLRSAQVKFQTSADALAV